jgi:Phage capsid family
MTRPLVPEDLARNGLAVRNGTLRSLTRACISHLMAASDGGKSYPHDIAESTWPTDRDCHFIVKAATSPTTTTTAPSLLRTLSADFLNSLAPVSAGSALLQRGLTLSFANGAAVIRIPRILASADSADFVGEGAAFPVQQLSVGITELSPRKFGTIIPFTNEIFSYSVPSIEVIVTQVLRESLALAFDVAVLGATAGDSTRPPGLRNGIAALTPSAAAPATEAMVDDISSLIAVVSTVAGNAPVVLIASPARAMTIRLRAPRDLPVEVLASGAVNDDELIAVASNAVASAVDAVPRFDASVESLVHMESESPLAISTAGSPNTIAAPVRSLWQTDCIGLRMTQEVSWGLRHASGLAWIDNITAW